MPQRDCNKTKSEVTRPCKTIVLPMQLDVYRQGVENPELFRSELDQLIAKFPELFPPQITAGYVLHDTRTSAKMPDEKLRRIKLKELSTSGKPFVLTVKPSGIMPYMVGYTDEIEKALFFRRFGVPYWGLTYGFGHNDMFWFRVDAHIGSYDIVHTTVKDAANLPVHLVADEKHTHINGEKGFIATTVGNDCVLGASLALKADTEELTTAYGVFKKEAQRLDPNYTPETVNNDGWGATQKAWKALFTTIVIIECFLHAFLKIRDRCKLKYQELYPEIKQQVWDIYKASDPTEFKERMMAFKSWGQNVVTGAALDAINKLCAKSDSFLVAYQYPEAYRTSNMVDRHMEPMSRWLYSSRYFHGHWTSAEKRVRAWALRHNFGPYCPRSRISETYNSPAHRLNKRVYHENWLHNLLISASLSGVDT